MTNRAGTNGRGDGASRGGNGASSGGRATTGAVASRGCGNPIVIVRWRQLPCDDLERRQVARDVAETVLGHIQRRFDAPCLLSATNGRNGITQAAAPLSYVEASERFAGIEWIDPSVAVPRVVTDRGRFLERELPARARAARKLNRMTESASPPNVWPQIFKKSPPRVVLRPGRGGLRPRSITDEIDVLAGIEQYGVVLWWAVSGGAMLGLIELAEDGNGVLWLRLSGDDQGETLDGQMKPLLGLVARNAEEFRPRYALIAIDMSGGREVRFDDGRVFDSGLVIRDDVLQIDRWIKEGWLEHVAFRDQRRLARDTLPGEQILRHLERNRIGLWFAYTGRKVDWVADRAMLRFFNVLSAEDRDNTNQQLQMARINRGPMLGKGWGPLPFGLYRDRAGYPRQDLEQWPFIRRGFELADALGTANPGDFSIRKAALALAAEGCSFSPSQMGKLLGRKTYVTGEYTVMVRGVEVVQEPIQLENPVPLDQFLRVRELLALRSGKSTNTNLGECLLNSVEAVHGRCDGHFAENGQPFRIRAYRIKQLNHDVLNYRHYPRVGPDCSSGGRNQLGGFTWPRDEIDPAVARAVRDLAAHPEVLREAALAARHTSATSSARLTLEQRSELEREASELSHNLDRLADEWVAASVAPGGRVDLEGFQRVSSSFDRRLAAVKTRLANDADAAAGETAAGGPRSGSGGHPDEDRVRTFLEIMSEETPEDPLMRQLRARLFQRIVQRVIIDDEGGDEITIILEGHLVPEHAALEAANPILACADLLDAYSAQKRGELPETEARLAREAALRPDFETVSQEPSSETLSKLYPSIMALTSTHELERLERGRLDYTGWKLRSLHSRRVGEPSWQVTIQFRPWSTKDIWRERLSNLPRRVVLDQLLIDAIAELGGEATVGEVCEKLHWERTTLWRRARRLVSEGRLEAVNAYRGSQSMAIRLGVMHENPLQEEPSDEKPCR